MPLTFNFAIYTHPLYLLLYRIAIGCQEEFTMDEHFKAFMNHISHYNVNTDLHWFNCELELPEPSMIGSPVE